MARRPLKPQLNQIRTWVRQGRTDAWIAHQLDVSVKDISSFKREHDLAPPDSTDGGSYIEESDLDLRAEDDALVAAELEAELEAEDEEADEEEDGGKAPREEGEEGEDGDDAPKRRRRGRRGGRGRGRGRAARPKALEGTFDHGEEGYGLWLDPAIQDDPLYAEHWAGHRPVTVAVEENRIVITRSGEDSEDD